MRNSLAFLPLLLLLPLHAGGDDAAVVWSENEEGDGDHRKGEFYVSDSGCAYEAMADPRRMGTVLKHLEGVTVHSEKDGWQDVTLTERFFPVGIVESRYHRQRVDGKKHLEWKLVEGRQARHDGFWDVVPDGDGARVVFENTIEAKSFLHRSLLRSIQRRAMADIANDISAHCGR